MRLASNLRGFTIVELLIVVVVVAILAAITIVAYGGITQQANQSAHLSMVSQAQKGIQLHSIQSGSDAVSIGGPVAYTTETGKIIPLTDAISQSRELTLYAVFDTTGDIGTNYIEVARLRPSSSSNNIFLRSSTGRHMGSRIDTSTSTNVTGSVEKNIRDTVGRHVGWITTKPGNFYIDFDGETGKEYTLATHDGWTFTDVQLNSNNNWQGVAALAFDEYHDEATRRAVLNWLDYEYNIDFYN